MTIIYANVGKMGNLARSLLLIHAKIGRFYRFFPLSILHKPLVIKMLQIFPDFEKSAFFCQNLLFVQNLDLSSVGQRAQEPSIDSLFAPLCGSYGRGRGEIITLLSLRRSEAISRLLFNRLRRRNPIKVDTMLIHIIFFVIILSVQQELRRYQ